MFDVKTEGVFPRLTLNSKSSGYYIEMVNDISLIIRSGGLSTV